MDAGAARRRSLRSAGVAAAPAAADAKATGAASSWRTLLSLLCHAALLGVFGAVLFWHTTPAALTLPGSRGFGRFARFLTFYSFTTQTLVWTLACCSDALLLRGARRARALATAADDAACATLPLATVVTLLYYGLLFMDPSLVEEDAVRPAWLSPTMHAANSVSAWGDVLLARPRSFSSRSARWSGLACGAYAVWIQVVRHVVGSYPYPVLNKLPHPHGYLGFTAAGMGLFTAAFMLGRALTGALGNKAAPRRRRSL